MSYFKSVSISISISIFSAVSKATTDQQLLLKLKWFSLLADFNFVMYWCGFSFFTLRVLPTLVSFSCNIIEYRWSSSSGLVQSPHFIHEEGARPGFSVLPRSLGTLGCNSCPPHNTVHVRVKDLPSILHLVSLGIFPLFFLHLALFTSY